MASYGRRWQAPRRLPSRYRKWAPSKPDLNVRVEPSPATLTLTGIAPDVIATGLILTPRIGAAFNPGSAAATTASFTPNNNSLLVVSASGGFDVGQGPAWAPTIADSAGLVWTQRVNVSWELSSWIQGIRVWTAPVTTGVSMTVSIDHGAAVVNAVNISVVDLTGYDTDDPTEATATDTAMADGADSISLSAAPADTSIVLAYLQVEANDGAGHATTPGTGWDEVYDFGSDAKFSYAQVQKRGASTSATVDWNDTHTGSGSFFSATGAALEIKASAVEGVISPPAAVLTLTGVAPTVLTPQTLAPAAASLVLTGVAPAVLTPVVAVPAAASLTLTGVAPTVAVSDNKLVQPDPAILTLTGQTPAVLTPVAVAPTPATLTLTGVAPEIRVSILVEPSPATLTLSGVVPAILVSDHKTVSPPSSTLTLTGVAPSVLTPVQVGPDPAVLTLTGVAPAVLTPVVVSPAPATLVLTGVAPQVTASDHKTVAPDPAVLVLTGVAPVVVIPLAPDPAVLTLTGIAPVVLVGDERIVVPDPSILVLTGIAPTILTPTTLAPAPATLTLTGFAPEIRVSITVSPSSVTLTLTGVAPAVNVSAHQTVSPAPAVLVLSGVAPVVTASDHQTVAPATALLTLTGIAPNVIVAPGSATVSPDPALLYLIGIPPNVSTGGEEPPTSRMHGGHGSPARVIWTVRRASHVSVDAVIPIEVCAHVVATMPGATPITLRKTVHKADPELPLVPGEVAPIPDPLAVPPDPEEWLDEEWASLIWDYTYNWAQEIGLTTWNTIAESVAEARDAEEASALDDIFDLIKGLFEPARARTIAVTETTRLLGMGAQTVYRRLGAEKWSWQNVNDPWVCHRAGEWGQSCSELQGKQFEITTRFNPNHPNCRCFPRPIPPPEEETGGFPTGDIIPLIAASRVLARRDRRLRVKHLPGQHDQKLHGHGGGAPVPAPPRPPARTFTSDEGYEWHREPGVQAWLGGVSEADVDMAELYYGFGSNQMNGLLRGDTGRFWKLQRRDATEEEVAAYRKWIRDPEGAQAGKPFRLPDGSEGEMEPGYSGSSSGWAVATRGPDTERMAKVKEWNDQLTAAVAERGYTIPEDMEVGRAAFVPGLTRAALDASVGGIITEPGFSSTMVGDAEGRLQGYPRLAKHQYEASQNDRKLPIEEGVAMIQRIRVPAGAKAMPVEAIRMRQAASQGDPGRRTESELLLPPGGRFRVLGVRDGVGDDGSPLAEVDLEYLP